MSALAPDELADFWALKIPVEAIYVPEDEWQRALAAARVQEVSSYSSMGTAETGWVIARSATADRSACAVVPPGETARHTEWADLADDRDTIAVCWQPLWDRQAAVALSHVPPGKRDALLEECARLLVELEGLPPDAPSDGHRAQLVDWLITGRVVPPAVLADELAKVKSRAQAHLVRGVRARWLTHDVDAAWAAVMSSAERGPKDFWGHGNVSRQREVRMRLLRFVVRLVRR